MNRIVSKIAKAISVLTILCAVAQGAQADVRCPSIQKSEKGADLVVVNGVLTVRIDANESLKIRAKDDLQEEVDGIELNQLSEDNAAEVLGTILRRSGSEYQKRVVVASYAFRASTGSQVRAVVYFGRSEAEQAEKGFAMAIVDGRVTCTSISGNEVNGMRGMLQSMGKKVVTAEAKILTTDLVLEQLGLF